MDNPTPSRRFPPEGEFSFQEAGLAWKMSEDTDMALAEVDTMNNVGELTV
jgi:hypothetical protein